MSSIKKNQNFVCIKTVKMNDSKEITYTKGYIYKSHLDGCITNNEDDVNHSWTEYNKETKKYFLRIKIK